MADTDEIDDDLPIPFDQTRILRNGESVAPDNPLSGQRRDRRTTDNTTEDATDEPTENFLPQKQSSVVRSVIPLSLSVNPLSETVQELVNTSIPQKQDSKKNESVFRLLRKVKAALPEATEDELRTIIASWHALAKKVTDKPFGQVFHLALKIWPRIRVPQGASVKELAYRMALESNTPTEALQAYPGDPVTQFLVCLCKQMQMVHGRDKEWFITTRDAAELINRACKTKIDFRDAADLFAILRHDKIIKQTYQGKGGGISMKASRHIYTASLVD
jgi:hypothetical protein